MAHVKAGQRQIDVPGTLELKYPRMDPSAGDGFSVVSVGTLDTIVSGLADRLNGSNVNPQAESFSHYHIGTIGIVGWDRTNSRPIFDLVGSTVFAGSGNTYDVKDGPCAVSGLGITDRRLMEQIGLDKTWVDVDYERPSSPTEAVGVLDLDTCKELVSGAEQSWSGNSRPRSVVVSKVRRKRSFFFLPTDQYRLEGVFYWEKGGNREITKFRADVTSHQLKFDRAFAAKYSLDGFARAKKKREKKVKPVVAQPAPTALKNRRRTAAAVGLVALAGAVAFTGLHYYNHPPSRKVELEAWEMAKDSRQAGDFDNAVAHAEKAHSNMPWYNRWFYGILPFVGSDYEDFVDRVRDERERARVVVAQPTAPVAPTGPTKVGPTKRPAEERPSGAARAPASRQPFTKVGQLPDGQFDLFSYQPRGGDSLTSVSDRFDRWDAQQGDRYRDTGTLNVVDRSGNPVQTVLADRTGYLRARPMGSGARQAPAAQTQAQAPRPAARAPVTQEDFEHLRERGDGVHVFRYNGVRRGDGPGHVVSRFNAWDGDQGDRYDNVGVDGVVNERGQPQRSLRFGEPVYVLARGRGTAASGGAQAGAVGESLGWRAFPIRDGDPLAAYAQLIGQVAAEYEGQHGDVKGVLRLRYLVDARGNIADVGVESATGNTQGLGTTLVGRIRGQYLADVPQDLVDQHVADERVVRVGNFWTRELRFE